MATLWFCSLLALSSFHTAISQGSGPPGSHDGEGGQIVMCNDAIELQDGILHICFDEDDMVPLKINLRLRYPNIHPKIQNSGYDAQVMRILANTIYVAPLRAPVEPEFVPVVTDEFSSSLLAPLTSPPICDVAISAITATLAREEQFNVNFLNYSADLPTLLAIPVTEKDEDWANYFDLCGKTISFNGGTVYQTYHLPALNDICDHARLDPVAGIPGANQGASEQLLLDGDVDAYMDGSSRVADFIDRQSLFKDAPVGCPSNPVRDGDQEGLFIQGNNLGLAVNKDATELIRCMEQAIAKNIENEKLTELFEDWVLSGPVNEILNCDYEE